MSSKCVRFTSISQFGMQLWFIREASRYTSLPASSGSLLWSLSRKRPKQLESIRDAQSTISSLGGAVKPGQAPSARANALAMKPTEKSAWKGTPLPTHATCRRAGEEWLRCVCVCVCVCGVAGICSPSALGVALQR